MRSEEFVIPERLELLEENPETAGVLHAQNVVDFSDANEAASVLEDLMVALENRDIRCIQKQDVFDQVYSLVKGFDVLFERSKNRLVDGLVANLSCMIPIIKSKLTTAAASQSSQTPQRSERGQRKKRTPGSKSQSQSGDGSDAEDMDETGDDSFCTEGDEEGEEVSSGGMKAELQQYRTCYKLYVYFLHCIAMASEAAAAESNSAAASEPAAGGAKGRGRQRKPKATASFGFQWDAHRPRVLRVLADAASVKLIQLYQGVKPEASLLDLFCRLGLKMYEEKTALKDEACRKEMNRMLAGCAVAQGHLVPVITGLLHVLLNSQEEHMGDLMADIGVVAETEFGNLQLGAAIVHEICRASPKDYARANSGAHQAGDFLIGVAEKQPKALAACLALMMPHLEYGESYVLRNAIVVAIGRLIVYESGIGNEGPAPDGEADEAVARARRLRSKQGLLAVLLERVRDSSAYVRSKVLQTWAWLCERKAIPLGHWNIVMEIAASRLQDKSSIVRKSALQLVNTLLQQNPFGPELQASEFEITLARYKELLAQHEKKHSQGSEDGEQGLAAVEEGEEEGEAHQQQSEDDADGAVDETGDEQAEAPTTGAAEEAAPEPADGQVVDAPAHDGQEAAEKDAAEASFGLEQTRALVASLEAGLKFSQQLSAALETLTLLLASPTTSDVEHCIQLLIALTQFRIDGAHSCLRKVIPLALSNEPSVREAVERAIASLHIEDRSPEEAAKSLMSLAGPEANLGELAALEALMQRFIQSGTVGTAIIYSLWDFFSFHQPSTTPVQSTSALILIAMCAKAKPGILSRRIPSILDIGLGRRAASNPLLARYACIALQRLSDDDRKEMGEDHRVFSTLASVIVSPALASTNQGAAGLGAGTSPSKGQFAVTEQAIRAIYRLHPAPERFCAGLLRRMAKATFASPLSGLTGGASKPSPLQDRTNRPDAHDGDTGSCVSGDAPGTPGADQSSADDAQSVAGEPPADGTAAGMTGPEGGVPAQQMASTGAVSHFVFASGQVALEHLVFVGQVAKAARKADRTKAQNKSQGQSEGQSQDKAGEEGAPPKGPKGGPKEDALADELGHSAAAEGELEVLQDRIEKQIVGGARDRIDMGGVRLITAVAPLIVGLCRSPEVQAKHPSLHVASIITLSKLMAIDVSFCENNLQLLFTILRKAGSPTVRSNVMIALGDLALRWPNLVEPWTENMYRVLKDENTVVRRHAVLVLSHLILNDMMKVKGFVSDLALCMEDPDKRIADLTCLFFHELARKGSNAVYNLLPDMLSRMSADVSLSDASLRNILQFLITFVNKDKQMEGLIDKLTHRFSAARDVRLWRTVAFCMTLLTYSDKGVKRLCDNYKEYKDALEDAEVLQQLLSATAKAKKFAKPEVKAMLDELEERMQKQHDEKREEEQAAADAMEQKRRAMQGKKAPGPKQEPVEGEGDAEDRAESDTEDREEDQGEVASRAGDGEGEEEEEGASGLEGRDGARRSGGGEAVSRQGGRQRGRAAAAGRGRKVAAVKDEPVSEASDEESEDAIEESGSEGEEEVEEAEQPARGKRQPRASAGSSGGASVGGGRGGSGGQSHSTRSRRSIVESPGSEASSNEQSSDNGDASVEAAVLARRGQATRRGPKEEPVSEEEASEEEMQRPRRQAPARRGRKARIADSDEESE